MAEELTQLPLENRFKNVQLLSEHTLGIGSYGKVCKAKCDDLLCAAKILHPTLYDPTSQQIAIPQREHRLPIQRFEQECRVMGTIRHPNIVQYLGLYRESSCTCLPVLLMELMDQSLTHFLDSSSRTIPYHIQINLCHDIALALSFLHSNHIIHRDLSSNNVLLSLGNIRAKVTDFGMARLGDISAHLSHSTFTTCPGTDAYMPPEAVQTNPVYTEKIDCFSFGVLTIQILTRQFPKPEERHKTIELHDPRFASGTIKVCISEIERRRNHISKIDSKHPLLPITLDCLIDKDIERPKAHELCTKLEKLKSSQQYQDEAKAAEKRIGFERDGNGERVHNSVHAEKHVLLLSQRKSLEEKDRKISELREELQQALHERGECLLNIDLKDNDLTNLRRQVEESERLIVQYRRKYNELQLEQNQKSDDQPKDVESTEISRSMRSIERDMAQLQEQAHKVRDLKKLVQTQAKLLEEKDLAIEQKERAIKQLESSITIKDQIIGRMNALNDQIVLAKDREIEKLKWQLQDQRQDKDKPVESTTVHLSYINQQLELSEQTVLHFQRRVDELEEQLSLRDPLTSLGEQPQSLQQLEDSYVYCEKELSSGERYRLQLQWREGRRAPREMCRWSDAISTDGTVYFRLLNTHKVYAYTMLSKEWTRLPDCLYHSCPLAIINGLLTAVGGYYHGYFNQLISFIGKGSEKKWTEILPPMPTKRSGATALNSGSDLLVAGGQGKDGKLTTVEVMNTDTLQWTTACPLIEPLYNASATLCAGDTVYMLGGYDKDGIATKSVYSCSLSELLQSCRRMSLGQRLKKAFTSLDAAELMGVWKRLSDLPVSDSTCVSVKDRLIAVGGKMSDETPTSAIYVYNSTTKSWEIVSRMMHPIGRYQCFAAVLPHDQLMVVGGWTANERASASVELATIYSN